MVDDAVEIGDGLVDVRRRGTALEVSKLANMGYHSPINVPRESLGENRLNQDILIVEEKHLVCDQLSVRLL